jgi:serine/threonine protein kinase/multidrug resistance efflux pump
LLPGDEQQSIEAHIGECEACQAELDALACGEDGWQWRVSGLERDHFSESPGLKRIIGILRDDGDAPTETCGFTPTAPEEFLGFLDPAESAGDLGKLGPYRVLAVLGNGGMGIVLKAFDPALHRAVAIKVLAPQLAASGSARQRFAREARAAAAIRNEHVVAIHSVDEWKGMPYLVMEFIPGGSLQDRIDRAAPLDPNSILRIGMQAAAGLAAAHAQGLVHRDIKPSNILLENCVERVKITDFGLARAVDDASLTQSGVVAGTPLFMAPEQARSELIDHRADLFSLGAVLYAMCTGRSPFRAQTTMGVLRRVCDDMPRPVREVNPEIPEELAAVMNRLLVKEPALRFQTATEVAEILGQILARRQQGWTSQTDPFPQPVKPSAVEDVGPAKRPRHSRLIQAAAYLLVLLSGVFVLAETTGTTKVLETIATVLRIKTPGGTLVLEVYDPEMKVQIDGESLTIHGPGVQSITIKPGSHRVETYKGQGRVSSEWITVSRGDKVQVKVGREPLESASGSDALRLGLLLEGRASLSPSLKIEVKGLHGQLGFIHHGRYLVGAGPGADIGICDTSTKTLRTHAIEGGDIRALAIMEDRTILTASADGRVRFWELFPLAEGDWPAKPLATPNLHSQKVTALALSSDSRLLALGSADGKLVLWDRKRDIRDDLAQNLGHAITTIRFAPDDSTLAVGLAGAGVEFWNVVRDDPAHLTGKGRFDGQPKDVRFLDYSHDGRFAAVASTTELVIWDRQGGQSSSLPTWAKGLPCDKTALCFSRRDANLLAVGLDDGTVVLWDADSNCQRVRFDASQTPIAGLAFSTDGRSLATWGRGEATTKIWDLGSAAQVDVSRAEHDFEKAQTALEEKIAQIEPIREKLEWARRMHEKGYVSKSALTDEMNHLFTAEADLQKAQGELTATSHALQKAQADLAKTHAVTPSHKLHSPPPKVPDAESVNIDEAAVLLRQGQSDREVARANVLQAGALLEQAAAQSDLIAKEVVQMEKLLGQHAVAQGVFEEAKAKLAAAVSDRKAAQAGLKAAESKLLGADVAIGEAEARLDLARASGKDMAQKREAARRKLAEMPLRHAQVERELAAVELEMARAALEGATAQRDWSKKALARIQRLASSNAVEKRLFDEARTRHAVASAKVDQAQAEVAKAEALLKAKELKVKEAEEKLKSQPRLE